MNIYSLPCDALLLLGQVFSLLYLWVNVSQIAYDEAKKAKDIDEALHFLSDKVERVTLLKQVPADTFTKDKAGRAALEICAAVFNYLAVAIKTFRHSALSTSAIRAPILIASEYAHYSGFWNSKFHRCSHTSRRCDQRLQRGDCGPRFGHRLENKRKDGGSFGYGEGNQECPIWYHDLILLA